VQVVHKALLQEPVNGKVRCLTCERRCLLVSRGRGWCRTRINQEGEIYTLTYGRVSSLSANPIEKKPFYHFFPGSRAMTAGSWSCNFGCPWCQNWDISKSALGNRGRIMSPARFVDEALRLECQGTSISFNEPTLSLEWSLDVFRLARARRLYNTYVTNGYMTAKALALLAEAGLDAMNVDIKGDAGATWKYGKGIHVDRIWDRCRQAIELGLHLEMTTLVIPGVNDSDACLEIVSRRIADELGPETPWHVSAYYPAYRFDAPPTPVSTLERAWCIGREAGLDYVYLGNVPGHRYENTYCPKCDALLIERSGLALMRCSLAERSCPRCGETIAGTGWDWAL
jgi:pyruvate formate lyase activating enzyme